MKIKIIEDTEIENFEDKVNDFIKDINLVSIDYEAYSQDEYTFYSALILYN